MLYMYTNKMLSTPYLETDFIYRRADLTDESLRPA